MTAQDPAAREARTTAREPRESAEGSRAGDVSAQPTRAGDMSARPTPAAGLAEVGKGRLLLLGALGALKALGLVLVADALAGGVVAVVGHADTASAVAEGLAGALVRALAVWALHVVSRSTAAGVKERLRIRLARAFLRRPGNVGAEAALATTGLDELDAYYTSYLPSLVSAATVPLLVGARILLSDWVSAVVIVATVPLIPFFMALIGLHTREGVSASLDALGRLSDHLVELARGLPVLVGLGRDREQADALEEISENHRTTSMTTLRTAFLSSLALDLLATISVAVVAVIIGVRLLHGELGLQAGLVALILAPECYAPLRDVGAAFHASDTGREALRRARDAIALSDVGHRLRRRTGSAVVVHRLGVHYPGRTLPVIADLSFRAPQRALTLLAGDSGAGKSTVLAVLAGRGATLDPEARCTGGVVAPRANRIVWMPQHPHFSSRTVADEVQLYAHGNGAALLDRVGLGPQADCDPAELSPGEARRLAFARTLAAVDAGATLVLLDEPTAHLDAVSAAAVRREITRLRDRATVIVASHDAGIRVLADRIVQVGTPAPAHPAEQRAALRSLTGREDAAEAAHTGHELRREADRETEQTAVTGEAELLAPGRRDHALRSASERGTPGPAGAIRELTRFLRPVGWRMLGAALVGVLSSGFAIALTALSGWLIVRASQEPAIMYLLVAIVGVRFFGIGRSVLRYVERLLTHDAVFRATTGLRLRLWRSLAATGPAGRRALSAANALGTLVGAADRMRDLVPRVVQPPVAAMIVAAGATVALWMLFPPAGLLLGCLAVVAVTVAPAVAVLTGRLAARQDERARAATLESFTDLLIARDDLTAAATERVLRRIRNAGAEAARGQRRVSYAEGVSSALVTAACCVAAVAMLPLAASAVASGALRPELVAVLVLVPLALIEPLTDGVTAASRAAALAGVLSRVAGASRPLVQGESDGGAEANEQAPFGALDGIRLDGVSYRYPDAALPVFDGVEAGARRGEWLAVTGPSGSGKSTLLALLLRFADPDKGRYLLQVSGRDRERATRDARTVSPRRLRTRVAWCPQEGHLFDSTLRANLVIARSRAERPTDAELTDALTSVGLESLLASLPNGLDTRIGSAGRQLSGGQRQRVAVARTLLAHGDVVLIDEPTAHLDAQASAELMADLRAALHDRTTILVTHDAAQARGADHTVELRGAVDAGRGEHQSSPRTADAA
jgi:ATP-binding cassette subfamily C protein CydCD